MNIVIFTIGEKEYGLDINQVRQVIRLRPIVPIPEAAEFVEGVISLRGKVIPLINLRKKFSLDNSQNTKSSRIIIAQINEHAIAVLVDKVIDVTAITPESITKPDDILKDAQYLSGVGKFDNRLFLMVDIEKVLTLDEKTRIKKIHERIEVRKKNG